MFDVTYFWGDVDAQGNQPSHRVQSELVPRVGERVAFIGTPNVYFMVEEVAYMVDLSRTWVSVQLKKVSS